MIEEQIETITPEQDNSIWCVGDLLYEIPSDSVETYFLTFKPSTTDTVQEIDSNIDFIFESQ